MHGDSPGGQVEKTSPSNAGAVGLIPDRGTRIPHASQTKHKKKQCYNEFNKDFKK